LTHPFGAAIPIMFKVFAPPDPPAGRRLCVHAISIAIRGSEIPRVHTLYRVEDDASTTYIDEYPSVVEGFAAGQHVVKTEDCDFSYALYADGVKVASLAGGRIGYREWARRNGRLADIHSLDDRLDHDVDELMA
jgi:hypothetical protein